MSLVNQLLDFRKIEVGGEVLTLNNGDINAFLLSIYEDFRLVAAERNINFAYQTDLASCYMYFDTNKVRKMINNLLSNAFKFTQSGGEISMALHEETRNGRRYAVISVKDTGKGIPVEEISRIFECFHQSHVQSNNMGSGIGLYLVKEYANLHQGDVYVQSEIDKGSIFSVYIPADLQASVNEILDIGDDKKDTAVGDGVEQEKKILIVEDNTEFRTYLKNELSHYYTVFEARDGLEGEREVLDKEPDIIITDLMMPGIDGVELCHRVKNNIAVSHIPVILLTANSNIENEKKGYKEGADAYMLKPFHLEILLLRIQNLIEQKLQRQRKFKKEIEVNPAKLTISAIDEILLKKVLEMVEKNLSNTEYSIEDLSSDMCMSRASLYRKINTLTGLSPTEFVKNIRLKKATELLKEGKYSVVEIADRVGFNTPSYFTKSFKRMFGVSPTQYDK